MAAPAPANGKLVTTIATPYATTTLQGSTGLADYIDYSNPNSYSFFGDCILSGSNLLFTVIDPFANKSGSYTLPLLSASTAIEYISRGRFLSGPLNCQWYSVSRVGGVIKLRFHWNMNGYDC